MGIQDISLISIPVSDPERSKQFYAGVLGFAVINDSPMGENMRWLMLAPPGGGAAITLVTWFESMPVGSLKGTILRVDDIDAAYEDLASKGVTFSGPIEEQPWGRFAQFDDPDGNGWIINQPPR